MRLKLTLLTTALAFGLGTTAALAEDAPGAKSDITIVGTDTGDAPSGAEQGTPGAADEGSANAPDESGAGGAADPSSPNASNEALQALPASPPRISAHLLLPSPV